MHLGSMMVTGCKTPGTLTLKMMCDDTCTKCNKTYSIKEKTCSVPHHMTKVAMGWSTPSPCQGQILAMTYNNSDCAGTAKGVKKMSESTCYSRHGRSHYFSCTNGQKELETL